MNKQHERTSDISQRLSKIEGHIRGIRKMVEERKKCEDILIQISAVQAALKRVSSIALEDHLENCIVSGIKEGREEKVISDFRKALIHVIGKMN